MSAKMNMGAFGPPRMDSPVAAEQAGPQALPQGVGDFASKLRSMVPQDANPGVTTGRMPPQDAPGLPRMPKQDGSSIQALSAMLAKTSPVVEKPKGEFVPGKRPEPTGPTALSIWNDPEQRKALTDVVTQWEKVNPGKSFKATHLAQAWNSSNPAAPLNEARARTLKAKIDKARDEYLMQQVAGYFGRGAKKAVLP